MQGLNILVAEDDPGYQLVIRKILETAEHRVTLVDDGEKALDALEEHDFDLIILDMNMPIINGIEVFKLFRFTSPHKKHVPVMLLTADNTPACQRVCEDAGIDIYVTKPVEPERLMGIIMEMTRHECSAKARLLKPPLKIVSNKRTPGVPLLDKQVLKELSNMAKNDAFMIALIRGYLGNVEKLLQQMKENVVYGQRAEIARLAHTLDGSSRSLGAERLAAAAAKLQRMVLESRTISEKIDLQEVETACGETRTALMNFLQEQNLNHI